MFSALAVQSQTISGWVVDEQSQPMPGCNIYVVGTFSGTSSTADGSFSFDHSIKDSAVLKIEFMGYNPQEFLLIPGESFTDLRITLTEEFSTLNAVTVTAGLYGGGEGEKAVVLNSLDIVTTAGSMGDITGAMQTLPGTATNGESGRLFVHGGTADETGTYIDGILVHQPYTSSTPNMAVRGRFNPFLFKGTSFSTGGYSAEYGQALSSVLILNTKEIPEEESLNISIMSIGGDLAGTKKWDNGAVTLSADYVNLSPYMNMIPQNYEWEKEPETYGAELSFRQKTAMKGMLKIYASVDESNMSQFQSYLGVEGLQSSMQLNNSNRFINANWKGMPTSTWMIQGGASYTHNKDRFFLDPMAIDEILQGSHAKLMGVKEWNKQLHTRLGAEYYYKSFDQSYQLGSADSSLVYTDHKPVFFAETEYYLSKKLVFVGGLRAEHSSYLNRANISPRFSTAYQFEKEHQVSFAYGHFYQDPINRYMLVSNALNYERAEHFILSYSRKIADRFLRLEAYYKNYTQLVRHANPFPMHINSSGHGYARGFDVYFRDRKTIKNGDYWISYSFVDSQREYLNFPEMANPSYANRHNLSVVYKHWFSALRSQLGATFTYGSPRSHNNPNSIDFMDEQLPAFKSLDANWSFLYRENIIFHVAVSNVLGFENQFGYNYSPLPNDAGSFSRVEILPAAKRFFFVGCFITLSPSGNKNQLEQIN